MLEHATDDRWREVVLLSVGLAGGMVQEDNTGPKVSNAERIIKGLMKLGDKNEQARHQLHLLAVACLEMAAECSNQTKTELQLRLANLVPPRSMTEAAALALAGELALPYLSFSSQYRVGVAGNCVRTLSLIGGEAALAKMETWARDHRRGVRRQLCRAMNYFSAEEYCRRILKHFISLELERLSSIEEIRELTLLKRLSLTAGTFTSLKGIESLRGSDNLELEHCYNLKDISHIKYIPNLVDITINSCFYLVNFQDLQTLPRLFDLTLWGNLRIY